MKRLIIRLSMTVFVAAIAAVALGLFIPKTADAAVPTYLTTARFNSLNAILLEGYATWVRNYPTHMARSANSWMDWSEDGCSVPDWTAQISLVRPFTNQYIHACERHDFMWRTLAVLDAGTGRI